MSDFESTENRGPAIADQLLNSSTSTIQQKKADFFGKMHTDHTVDFDDNEAPLDDQRANIMGNFNVQNGDLSATSISDMQSLLSPNDLIPVNLSSPLVFDLEDDFVEAVSEIQGLLPLRLNSERLTKMRQLLEPFPAQMNISFEGSPMSPLTPQS
jgi:hypothetical protein